MKNSGRIAFGIVMTLLCAAAIAVLVVVGLIPQIA